jgi:two-component system chemotaxis response regulator CheB
MVEDSTVIRSIISRIFEQESDIEIVGQAINGKLGVDQYKALKPDLVLMDIEMPVMNGIDALQEIMNFDPKAKVIMCSTLTVQNAEISIKALKIGAVDTIAKPSNSSEAGQSDAFKQQLIRLVRAFGKIRESQKAKDSGAGKAIQLRSAPPLHWKPKVIAVGSSTGGPQALFAFMKGLATIHLPVVITQHMPPTFTTLLAQHISHQAGFECREGANGVALEAGKAILAPGGKHMLFKRHESGQVVVDLNDGPQENFCKPAVDPMFRSLMDHFGGNILSVILTGMGHDGQKGVELINARGGYCVAQDKATSVVWGMPGAVAENGLCSAVLPLSEIAPWVKQHARL